ncbi:MAG TPA: outer membrane beta-barrel protein [Verrucomicrobiae bacterium]|nr:outer membrane beta-barrel protein [Verrucomicrobiae bacterium]
MTNSRVNSHIVRLVTVALLTLGSASYAADPLQPSAVAELKILEPPIVIPALRLGIFDLHPQVSAGVTYDDNIALSATGELADWIWTVTPHLAAIADNTTDGYGTLLTLEYGPSFQTFTQHSRDDTVDHHANLAASWAGAKLSLALTQTFDQTKTGVIEVGQRLQQREYATILTSKYKLGERTSVELNPRLTISETDGLIGSKEYGVDAFLNRLVTSKITGSVGGSYGYIDATDGSIQTYQRALGRVTYALSGKVEAEASAGGEWREFHGDRSATLTPVLGIGGAYRPFEGTTITLEAHRRDEVSAAFSDENYTASGVTLGLFQRVLDRLHVTLTGSYENRDYHPAATGVTAVRNDNIYTGRAGIGANLGRHWTVDIFYQYTKDDTNIPDRRFTDNQFGVVGTWKL